MITRTFLDLPLEIRQQIYAHVLAPGMLHFQYRNAEELDGVPHYVTGQKDDRPGSHLRQRICLSHRDEALTTEEWLTESGPGNLLDRRFKLRHAPCLVVPRYRDEREPEISLHLTVLRACRQIYLETRLMPYKDNVLSFYGTDAFQAFMKARTSEQKAAVTKLHFALCVLNVNKMERFWNDNITAANVLHLKGLKSLYIDLDIGVTSLKELAVLVRNGLLPLFYHKGLLRFCLANASSTNKDLLGARSDGLKHCTVKITHSGLDDKRLSPVIFDPDYGWWCRDPARVEWMAATRRRTEAVKLQARLLTQEANQVLTPNEKSSVEDLRRELLTYDNH